MKTTLLNTDESRCKWFAIQDRRMKNTVNRSHYSDAQQVRVQRMQYALELVYAGVVYEPSYGKRGISVKVTGWVKNKQDLALLEADWAKQGIEKRVSAQGITYRVGKQ